jgi:hypothetical protein
VPPFLLTALIAVITTVTVALALVRAVTTIRRKRAQAGFVEAVSGRASNGHAWASTMATRRS